MKNILISILLAFLYPLGALGQAIPTTPNLGLQLIPDGYMNWGVPYRTTMTTIDNKVAPKLNAVFTGTFSLPSGLNGCLSAANGVVSANGLACGSGSGNVTSVFSRTGVITSQSGDYAFTQISGLLNLATQVTGTLAAGNVATLNQNTTGSAASLSANLPVSRLNSGTGATSSTFWRGDGTWATPTGSGTVTASPQFQFAYYNLAGTVSTVAGDTGFTTDGAGNVTAASYSALGTANGNIGLTATGTPPSAAPANTIQVESPSAVTAYRVELPGAAPTSGNTFLSCTAASPSVCTWAAGGSGIANITVTLPTTAVSANTCTTPATATMTGVTTTSTFTTAFATNPNAVTGWGSSGGLTFTAWPTANTLNWSVCNQTGSSITPGALTLNVGAR